MDKLSAEESRKTLVMGDREGNKKKKSGEEVEGEER